MVVLGTLDALANVPEPRSRYVNRTLPECFWNVNIFLDINEKNIYGIRHENKKSKTDTENASAEDSRALRHASPFSLCIQHR